MWWERAARAGTARCDREEGLSFLSRWPSLGPRSTHAPEWSVGARTDHRPQLYCLTWGHNRNGFGILGLEPTTMGTSCS